LRCIANITADEDEITLLTYKCGDFHWEMKNLVITALNIWKKVEYLINLKWKLIFKKNIDIFISVIWNFFFKKKKLKNTIDTLVCSFKKVTFKIIEWIILFQI